MSSSQSLKNVAFLIPSLDPDEKMPLFIEGLLKAKVKHIIVVNDGSKTENLHYFDQISVNKEVVVLNHIINQGKGRALKTGFNYVLDKMKDIKAVVTADADGQHAVEDTIACAIKTLESKQVVFGTRNFNEDIVPFKSRNGNKITTFIFKLLYGKQVNDTQTGLRGLPIDFVYECLKLKGERFDYEISMLISIVEQKRTIIEEPIKTIYFESNRATHFDTFKDSYKIYKIMLGTLLRFTISSLLSFIIDWGMYTTLINTFFKSYIFTNGIILSTILARIVSSLFNFTVNKNNVFESNERMNTSLLKYYLLAFCQMLISGIFVSKLFSIIKIDSSIIKIFVDFLLFIISYFIQKKWVFKSKDSI